MSAYVLNLHNPGGAIDIEQQHAARLQSLEGSTLAMLGNGAWEDQTILPAVRAALQARVKNLNVIGFEEWPRGHENIDNDATIDMLVKRGVHGVVTGNAA